MANGEWPSLVEFKAWLSVDDGEDDEAMTVALSSAVSMLKERVRLPGDVVTDDIAQACLLRAQRLLARRNSPSGVQAFGDFAAIRVSRLDPDELELLGPYLKIAVA